MSKAKIIPYNPKLKQLARNLRKNMTFGEVLLWNELKLDQFAGFDFDRQRCIHNYIVDFYCKELKLVIEIDGLSHDNEEAFIKDQQRQSILEGLGLRLIRFTEAEIKYDLENVRITLETEMISIIKSDPSIKLPSGFDPGLLA